MFTLLPGRRSPRHRKIVELRRCAVLAARLLRRQAVSFVVDEQLRRLVGWLGSRIGIACSHSLRACGFVDFGRFRSLASSQGLPLSLREYISSSLIGTPLQKPAAAIRSLRHLPRRWKHPELRDIFLEDKCAELVLRRAITPEMNCIDIGCHLGSVLDQIVKLAPRGTHTAIEPLPYKAAWLKRKFPAVEIHQVALGEKEGVVDFFYRPSRSGYSGLGKHGSGDATVISVECKLLDDIVPADRRIGFMKVDVEGGEYAVFRGARRILTENRPIMLFECTASGLKTFGYSNTQVFSCLVEESRYHIFTMQDWLSGSGPLNLEQFQSSMVYPFKAFNFVAAPA